MRQETLSASVAPSENKQGLQVGDITSSESKCYNNNNNINNKSTFILIHCRKSS